MTLDDRAKILHIEIALEHALGEVADRCHHGHDSTKRQQIASAIPARRLAPHTHQEHGAEGHHSSPDETLKALVRADPLAQRRLADCTSDEQGADVVGDNSDRDQTQRVGTDGLLKPSAVIKPKLPKFKIAAPNEPRMPIQPMARTVIDMFGIGFD